MDHTNTRKSKWTFITCLLSISMLLSLCINGSIVTASSKPTSLSQTEEIISSVSKQKSCTSFYPGSYKKYKNLLHSFFDNDLNLAEIIQSKLISTFLHNNVKALLSIQKQTISFLPAHYFLHTNSEEHSYLL
jgi:hypothetical protein